MMRNAATTLSVVLLFTSFCRGEDTSAPSGSVTSPRAFSISYRNSSVESLGHRAVSAVQDLVGVAADDESGIDWVKVQILRERRPSGPDAFWNGAAWQADPVFLRAIIVGDTWTIPDVDLTAPDIYRIRIVVRDNAGNESLAIDNGVHTIYPVVDHQAPTGSVHSPDAYEIITPDGEIQEVGASFPEGLYPIWFRITDDATGVQRAVTQVYHFDRDQFFNGVEWQDDPVWIPIAKRTQFPSLYWETLTDVSFDRPGDYAVRLNLRDYAGNVADTTENPVTIFRVIEDTVLPYGQCVGPSPNRIRFPDGRVRQLIWTEPPGRKRVTGFAEDEGSGVRRVKVQIERRGADRDYWNGVSWQVSPVWVRPDVFDSDTQVRWRVLDVDMFQSAEYVVRVSVCDNAGNQSRAQQNPISYILVP